VAALRPRAFLLRVPCVAPAHHGQRRPTRGGGPLLRRRQPGEELEEVGVRVGVGGRVVEGGDDCVRAAVEVQVEEGVEGEEPVADPGAGEGGGGLAAGDHPVPFVETTVTGGWGVGVGKGGAGEVLADRPTPTARVATCHPYREAVGGGASLVVAHEGPCAGVARLVPAEGEEGGGRRAARRKRAGGGVRHDLQLPARVARDPLEEPPVALLRLTAGQGAPLGEEGEEQQGDRQA